MDNDLIVINNNTDASTSNSKNEFHSLNNNSFNHLSKTNSNNIDFGADDSPNFNDAEYEEAWNKAEANDNFYDDSNEYYSKGSVYKNDFTEDFPNINSTYLSKLHAELKDSYDTKIKNAESNSDLILNNDTSNEIFGFLKDEVQFEKDKVLFKPPTFNSINPEFIDKSPFKPVTISFVLWFSSLFLFNYIRFNFFFFILSCVSCAIVFIMILSIFLITYAKQFAAKHYLVLDYSKQIFYHEKRTSFNNTLKPLFAFNDIVTIGLSSERNLIDGGYNNFPTIYFLLKNGNSFKFCQSDQNTSDSYTYYSKFVQVLSSVLKKPYFNNPHNNTLYKKNSLEKGPYFTTDYYSSKHLSENNVVIPEKKSIEITTSILIFILGLYYLGLVSIIFGYRF